MEPLRIVTVISLFSQLYLVRGNLPMLPGNKLLTGDAREHTGAIVINCEQGDHRVSDFKESKTSLPTLALLRGLHFERFPFTSSGVVPGALVNGGFGKFSFAVLTLGVLFKRTVYALQTSAYGEYAYWLPQGGYVDVPQYPSETDPHFVFTPDFSGCSWTVTPMDNGMLRLRHVEGGHEEYGFNNLPYWQKGGGITYAMQFRDYGYVMKNGRLVKHVTAYAYMHFSDCQWTLRVQHQTCAPSPGNTVYEDGEISSMKMSYFSQRSWDYVTFTETWVVPKMSNKLFFNLPHF